MSRLQVGDWIVDGAEGTLTGEGRVVRLEPRVMAVLLALAERPGILVPQDELLRLVWADTHVAPGALTRAISLIRSALGDDPRQARYVETLHKRGYRLVAPVREMAAPVRETVADEPAASPPPPVPRPAFGWRPLGVATLAMLGVMTVSHEDRRPRPRPFEELRANQKTREGNENAYAHYRRAVALDPSSADAHTGLAMTYAFRANYLPDRGRWSSLAVETASRATRLDPDNVGAVKVLGISYAQAGRFQRAVPLYRRTLELRPDDGDARVNLGLALCVSGRLAEAMGQFEQQVAAFPERADGYANLANALAVAGYEARGSEMARAAIALQPYARTAQLTLVREDLLGGRHDAARVRLERLLEVGPDCATCLVQLGLIEQLAGRSDRARDLYGKARVLSPPFPTATLRLAQLEVERGRPELADALLGEVERVARLEIASGTERYYPRWQLAIAASLRGDPRASMDWYAQSVATGRRDEIWDAWDPLLAGIRRQDGFGSLQEPFRAERRAAAAVVERLGHGAIDWPRRYDLLSAVPDPPGWR
jgi:transcriptional activator of cad operon